MPSMSVKPESGRVRTGRAMSQKCQKQRGCATAQWRSIARRLIADTAELDRIHFARKRCVLRVHSRSWTWTADLSGETRLTLLRIAIHYVYFRPVIRSTEPRHACCDLCSLFDGPPAGGVDR